MAVKGTRNNKPQRVFHNSGAQPLSTMHPDHPRRNSERKMFGDKVVYAFEAKSPTQKFVR